MWMTHFSLASFHFSTFAKMLANLGAWFCVEPKMFCEQVGCDADAKFTYMLVQLANGALASSFFSRFLWIAFCM